MSSLGQYLAVSASWWMQSESAQVFSSNTCGIILKGDFALEVQLSLAQNCAKRKYVIILSGITAGL